MGLVVQITKVRRPGDCSVAVIRKDGSVQPRKRGLLVRFPRDFVGDAQLGTLWNVSGELTEHSFKSGDFVVNEDQLQAKTAKFLRLSGDVLAFWLEVNIPTIGEVIAKRVARTARVRALIEEKNVGALCEIQGVSEARAYALIQHWPNDNVIDAIEWLQAVNISPRFAKRIIHLFGPEAIGTISRDPFLLLAVGATWKESMALAASLGMGDDHPATQTAILVKSAVDLGARGGHSVTEDAISGDLGVSKQALLHRARVLSKGKATVAWLDEAVLRGAFCFVANGSGLMPMGAALIEDSVARFIARSIRRKPGYGSLLAVWERGVTKSRVKNALAIFEGTLSFDLTVEQRDAVVGAVMSPVACISGGAGTGKTTILEAILGVYKEIAGGLILKLVALSGRAAQRMAESTGDEACTIAKLIGEHVGEGKPEMPNHVLLIIDEASMVDIISMYRLAGILPLATRVLFVGDVGQLPPVGPGLVFHSLTKSGVPVPTFILSQVKRQAEESGIHSFATAIRNGKTYQLPKTQPKLSATSDASIDGDLTIARAYDLWLQAGGRGMAIIIAPVRMGELGVSNVNTAFQCLVGENRELVMHPYSSGVEWRSAKGQWLFLGDPVIVNQNDYELDVRNGDLGYLSEVWHEADEAGAVGMVTFDSGLMPLTLDLLEKLELAYAITVHKSQGSQWPTVIVTLPIEANRMIDQTLLYTAATRPKSRLIVMGDEALIGLAVQRGNVALRRKVCLGHLVSDYCGRPSAVPV